MPKRKLSPEDRRALLKLAPVAIVVYVAVFVVTGREPFYLLALAAGRLLANFMFRDLIPQN